MRHYYIFSVFPPYEHQPNLFSTCACATIVVVYYSSNMSQNVNVNQYMVVLDLPVIDEEESYSIAHSSWLNYEDGSTVMFYPSRSSINKALRLKKKPEHNWMKAVVEVVATFNSLDDAKAKMKRLVDFESTTVNEDEDVIPPRKSRLHSNPKFADCVMWNDQDSELLPQCPTLKKDIPISSIVPRLNSIARVEDSPDCTIPQTNVIEIEETSSSRNYSTEVHYNVFGENSFVNTSNDNISVVEYVNKLVQTEDKDFGELNHQLVRDIVEIKNLLVSFHFRMQNIENYIQRGSGGVSNAQKVNVPELPVTNVDELTNLNEKLIDTKVYQALVQLLKRNMGNNARDCIYKMLQSCFSLEMARTCSLMGKNNNVKLDGMLVMNMLKDAAIENYSNLSNDLFRSAIMDWFRGAELRYRRKKNQL